MDVLDNPRLGETKQVVIALLGRGVIGKALAAITALVQAVFLDHRSHRPVQDEYPGLQFAFERRAACHLFCGLNHGIGGHRRHTCLNPAAWTPAFCRGAGRIPRMCAIA